MNINEKGGEWLLCPGAAKILRPQTIAFTHPRSPFPTPPPKRQPTTLHFVRTASGAKFKRTNWLVRVGPPSQNEEIASWKILAYFEWA